MDVARKVVILARECGLQLGLDDLTVASLVPPQLASLATPADYMAALPQVIYISCFLILRLWLGVHELQVASLVSPQLAALLTPAEFMAALPQVGR
jgi:hypothetical protein